MISKVDEEKRAILRVANLLEFEEYFEKKEIRAKKKRKQVGILQR